MIFHTKSAITFVIDFNTDESDEDWNKRNRFSSQVNSLQSRFQFAFLNYYI